MMSQNLRCILSGKNGGLATCTLWQTGHVHVSARGDDDPIVRQFRQRLVSKKGKKWAWESRQRVAQRIALPDAEAVNKKEQHTHRKWMVGFMDYWIDGSMDWWSDGVLA